MKRYLKPTSEVVELNVTDNILLVLSKTEEEMPGEGALSNEHREGDWSDIWKNM